MGGEWGREKKFLVISMLLLPFLLNLAGVVMLYFAADARLLFETMGLASIMFVAGLTEFCSLVGFKSKANYVLILVFVSMLFLDLIVLLNANPVLPEVPWAVGGF